jgi:hypothetical protein
MHGILGLARKRMCCAMVLGAAVAAAGGLPRVVGAAVMDFEGATDLA